METQTCLYEVLGVDRSASIDEIRSAYRKLALKWHPDKIQQSGASPDACQEATIRFQEIGRAYEVLADPAERAWYDSHRSQILSSSSSSSHSEGFEVNLWPYFSPTVFSGYGETGKGFYAVYNDVFRKLHQQEVAFAHAHGVRPPVDPPDMGGPATPYAQVSRFYNYWLGFGTVKDFSWCDEYRTSLGPNRKVRRLMEEENKKIRSKARKEFNEAVRRLAAFVKRRDKRVLERQVEVQRLEKEKEERRKLKRQQEEAEKALKAKLYEEAEWTKAVDDTQLGDDESDVDDSLGSYDWDSKAGKSGTGNRKDRQEEFYCIICNKKFRSEEQWRNHERSKKHLDRVASLKESFREEDENIEARLSAMSTPQAIDEPVVEKSLAGSPIDDSAEEDHKDVREENGEEMDTLMSFPATGDPMDEQETISSDGETGEDESSLLNMVNWHQQNRKEARLGNLGSDTTEDEVRRDNEKEDQVNEEVKEHDGYNEGEEKVKEDETIAVRNAEEEEEEEGGNEEVINNGCDVEEKEQEDNDETFMVMTKSYKNRQKWEDDVEQESYMPSRNHAAESHMVDNVKKRTKGKRRAEKKQASGSDRHSELAEVLMLEKQVDRMMLNHEISGYNKDSQSHDVILQETASEGARLPKGGRLSSHATALKEQIRKPTKGKKNKGTAKMPTITCEVCGEDFESRNLLFKHISTTNHAVLKGR